MKIAIGCDHGGFEHKEAIKEHLLSRGFEVKDFGIESVRSVDYPDIAEPLARSVAKKESELGILVCGTGIGMSLAANKVKGIRCALCSDTFSAKMTRIHNNSNMLALGARVIGVELAKEIVNAWLDAEFEGGRHQVRIDMITALENGESIE